MNIWNLYVRDDLGRPGFLPVRLCQFLVVNSARLCMSLFSKLGIRYPCCIAFWVRLWSRQSFKAWAGQVQSSQMERSPLLPKYYFECTLCFHYILFKMLEYKTPKFWLYIAHNHWKIYRCAGCIRLMIIYATFANTQKKLYCTIGFRQQIRWWIGRQMVFKQFNKNRGRNVKEQMRNART